MPNPKELSDSLALAVEHIRALHGILAALTIDVSAQRKIVLNSPKTSRRYRHALAIEAEKVKPLVAIAMEAYDKEILRLKSLGQWRN